MRSWGYILQRVDVNKSWIVVKKNAYIAKAVGQS